MAKYAILRTEKLKTFDKIKSVGGHHSRTHNVKNADENKSEDNINLVQCDDLLLKVKDRIGNKKIRKNGVIAVEVLMTASPEFFRENAIDYGEYEKDKVDIFNRHAQKFLEKEFGAENIASSVCHLDEATPHVQAVIVPIDPETGRLNASYWLDGRKKLSEMQDRFFNEMKELGLERGLKGSESKHTTIKQFYGALESAEKVEVPAPNISTPPMLLKEKSRKEWAENEAKTAFEEQKPHFSKISQKAAVSSIASKRAKEATKSSEKYRKALEKMKNEANLVRDMELSRVMQALGAERDKSDKKQWLINGEKISITGKKFFNFNRDVGGGGAIDLVMHVENLNFKDAVSYLSGTTNRIDAIGAGLSYAQNMVVEQAKKPMKLPIENKQNWQDVRSYLIDKRHLSERTVDFLYKNQRIYADNNKNVCFMYGSSGVERRGVGVEKWRGFVGEKKAGFKIAIKEPVGVVFVESAVDAISLYNLQKPELKKFDIVAVGGVSRVLTIALSKKYEKVFIGFDNDQAGDRAYIRIKESIECERIKPTLKDFNEDLCALATHTQEHKEDQEHKEEYHQDRNRGMIM